MDRRLPSPSPAYTRQPPFAARQTLNSAINDVRLVGGVYLFLGALLIALLVMQRAPTPWPLRVAVLADSVMLFGPGLWYLFAGSYLRRLENWAVTVSLRVGLAQLAVILVGVFVGVMTSRDLGIRLTVLLVGVPARALAFRSGLAMVIAPAIIACFFVPALIAVLFSLRRAGRVMRLLDVAGHAFEPVNVHEALPVDSEEHPITAT